MEFGWKYIWKLYGWKALFSRKNRLFYFSILVVLISLIILLKFNTDSSLIFDLINKFIEIGLSILPNLLGFNLGAYALIIGFLSNKTLLEALTKNDESNSKNSLERISGVFAINIITQAFALLFTFLIKISILIDSKVSLLEILHISNYYVLINFFNYLIFTLLLFLNLYSVALVIQNAINIFDFSQLFTYFSTKEENNNT